MDSPPILLEDRHLEDASGNFPAWMATQHGLFSADLRDNRYPCFFGTAALKREELRYGWVEGEDLASLPHLMFEFLRLSRSSPSVRHALAVFRKPEEEPKSIAFYRRQFWETLDFLHRADPRPWPESRPPDPAHPNWEFCFEGEPMFVFCCCPAYRNRRSRNTGDSLILLFQPRRIFQGIEGGTLAGRRAREIIRERLRRWDAISPHPALGSYGSPSSHEWKQYFLPDDESPSSERCPFQSKEAK